MDSTLRLELVVAGVLAAVLAVSGGCTPQDEPGAQAPSAASTPADSLPRAYDGKPDLNGIWQTIGTAHWNLEDHGASAGPPALGVLGATPPGKGVVVGGGEIPYQDWALTQRQANFDSRFADDPEAKCYLPGVPRATYLPYPFQVLQGTNKIMLVYGVAEANRTIHMTDNPEPPPIDSWMGRSHGRWDGDTLVVEALGFNGQAWLDRAGNFASDTLRVEERYTLLGPNAMRYEATLEDPAVFTAPWTISMPLYRRLEGDAEILEYKCVEFSEEMLYGNLRRDADQ